MRLNMNMLIKKVQKFAAFYAKPVSIKAIILIGVFATGIGGNVFATISKHDTVKTGNIVVSQILNSSGVYLFQPLSENETEEHDGCYISTEFCYGESFSLLCNDVKRDVQFLREPVVIEFYLWRLNCNLRI